MYPKIMQLSVYKWNVSFLKSSCSLIVSAWSTVMTAAHSSSWGMVYTCVGATFPFPRRNLTSCFGENFNVRYSSYSVLGCIRENVDFTSWWMSNGERHSRDRGCWSGLTHYCHRLMNTCYYCYNLKSTEEQRGWKHYGLNQWNIVLSSTIFLSLSLYVHTLSVNRF